MNSLAQKDHALNEIVHTWQLAIFFSQIHKWVFQELETEKIIQRLWGYDGVQWGSSHEQKKSANFWMQLALGVVSVTKAIWSSEHVWKKLLKTRRG